MKKNYMVHCSFEIVEKFEPRIPKNRIEGNALSEDNTIPRICVSTDIRKAINAIPDGGLTIKLMKEMKIPMIIHAYYLYSNNFIKPSKELLPDVDMSGEHWLLQEPDKIYRKDYEILNPYFLEVTDVNERKGTFMVGCNLRQAKFQDNLENFCKACHITKDKIPEGLFFRKIITNIGPILIQKFFA